MTGIRRDRECLILTERHFCLAGWFDLSVCFCIGSDSDFFKHGDDRMPLSHHFKRIFGHRADGFAINQNIKQSERSRRDCECLISPLCHGDLTGGRVNLPLTACDKGGYGVVPLKSGVNRVSVLPYIKRVFNFALNLFTSLNFPTCDHPSIDYHLLHRESLIRRDREFLFLSAQESHLTRRINDSIFSGSGCDRIGNLFKSGTNRMVSCHIHKFIRTCA